MPLVKTAKHIILVLILGVLVFPSVQNTIIPIPPSVLQGVDPPDSVPDFPWKTWYNAEERSDYNKAVEENVGLRSYLIKLRNQVDFSLLNFTEAPGVVIGKEGCLFIESYINNYTGLTFKGTAKIDYEISKLEAIQFELKKRNIDFLLVFAPGKATFNAENIPDRYKMKPMSNYGYYTKRIARSGINFIDMNGWFKKMKNKTSYPLYSKGGVHWTSYGVGLAADSMFRYIEKLRNIDLPEFGWDQVEVSDSLRYSDNDACELMNLFFPPYYGPMPYPKFRYDANGKTRPHVMTIGDSYWWGFASTGITENVFSQDNYWFYNKVIFLNGKKINSVSDVSLKEEINKQDLLIMIVTEATYELFPYGFIEAFFTRYLSYWEADKSILMEIKTEEIKQNPQWYQSIVEKAEKNKIPVEEQLKRDVQYLVEQQESVKK